MVQIKRETLERKEDVMKNRKQITKSIEKRLCIKKGGISLKKFLASRKAKVDIG